MNSILKSVQKEIKRMRQADDSSGDSIIYLVLVFDRSEEDMKKLPGYSAFAHELAELGGERTEENIQEACRRSCFSRESVFFDEDKQKNDQRIKLRCTKQQSIKFRNAFEQNNTSNDFFV